MEALSHTFAVTRHRSGFLRRLIVGEDRIQRIALGHGSRRDGIAEVLRPPPVSNLGLIFKMFSNIVVVTMQFLVEEGDCPSVYRHFKPVPRDIESGQSLNLTESVSSRIG